MFKLYQNEVGTFRFADYAILMREAHGKQSVLEFGPGYSTFALIEAGVPKIVTLEHDPEWFDISVERFKDYPQVEIRRYQDEPVVLADVEEDFDFAFVDSPKGFKDPIPGIRGVRKRHPGMLDCSRLNTCLFALERAPIVYLHDAYRPCERGSLGRLAAMGHPYEFLQGSQAGFARITRNGKNAHGLSASGTL